jgi:uncharacterized protein YjaG (DUF416 family)
MNRLASLLVTLAPPHQTVLLALTCDKMRASVAAFDAQEEQQGSPLFAEAITALFAFSLGQPVAVTLFPDLTDRLNAFWPDLDASINPFASYAFDACVALSEALAFVQDGDMTHVLQCLTAATDTVDMYVQDTQDAELELEPEALTVFIDATPLMQQELHRQERLVLALLERPILDSTVLALLQQLNEAEPLVDLAAL